MPIVELFGREYAIPFDAEWIATLRYQGIPVYPDDNANEKQLAQEQEMINTHLFKLWKDENLRTVPRRGLDTKPSIENPPVTEEAVPGKNFPMPQFQGTGKQYTTMKVIPTPKTTFNLRDVSPYPFNRKPLATEM